MRVLLCDDHRILRDGLRLLLEQEGFQVVGEASNGRRVLELAEACRPELVVMDVSMPELNGVDATQLLLGRLPGVKVVALSMNREPRHVLDMLRAGASGYVHKASAADELIRALHSVMSGREYVSPSLAAGIATELRKQGQQAGGVEANVMPLSAREREVLQLVAEGRSSKEIAACLGIATSTVETHRRQIMDKVGLRTVAELTKYAVREGLTPGD